MKSDRVSPTDMLRSAASLQPPRPATVQTVAESAFLISCMIDVEIARLSSNPEHRDRMLALVQQHIEQRLGSTR